MVAMPYILVNLVLETFSWILFCVTSAALLSKYTLANRYLPAPLRTRRMLAFLAHGLLLSVLSMGAAVVVARGGPVFISSQFLFELFFYMGVANSMVLTYQFLDRRVLRNAPRVSRRLLIALCAFLMPSAAAIAIYVTAVRLFVIR